MGPQKKWPRGGQGTHWGDYRCHPAPEHLSDSQEELMASSLRFAAEKPKMNIYLRGKLQEAEPRVRPHPQRLWWRAG